MLCRRVDSDEAGFILQQRHNPFGAGSEHVNRLAFFCHTQLKQLERIIDWCEQLSVKLSPYL